MQLMIWQNAYRLCAGCLQLRENGVRRLRLLTAYDYSIQNSQIADIQLYEKYGSVRSGGTLVSARELLL